MKKWLNWKFNSKNRILYWICLWEKFFKRLYYFFPQTYYTFAICQILFICNFHCKPVKKRKKLLFVLKKKTNYLPIFINRIITRIILVQICCSNRKYFLKRIGLVINGQNGFSFLPVKSQKPIFAPILVYTIFLFITYSFARIAIAVGLKRVKC